ncbi:MAG: hypothetical protein WCJ92_07940 [Alphaproteobacteria bacterium]
MLTKLLNSPLIKRQFPNIDNVVIRDVEERFSHPESVIVRTTIHLNERLPRHNIFFLEEINPKLLDLLKTIGIGGNYNYFSNEVIEPDDTN